MRSAAAGRSRASSAGSASSPVLHSVSAEADKTVSEIMLSASSEMLSLLDSRNVDVRIRSIVARAEQEAASKLQAAHPDDDEDSVPARRRKGGSDRASRRRELNRVNAKKSRLRKKFFIEALILRVARLEKEAESKAEASTPVRPVLPPPAACGAAQQPAGRSTHSSDSTAATLVSVSVPTADPSTHPFGSATAQSEQGDSGRSSAGGSSPSDAAAAAVASAGSPGAGLTSSRAVPASALSPRLRDALVVSGPDWPLVQLLESTSQAFCIADPCSPDMPLAYVSPGFEALTGYASSEAIGRNCRFLQGPGTDKSATRRMGEALKQGRGCSEVLLNYRRDGAPFWNRVLLAPLRDSTGAVRSFVSVQACVSRSLASIEQGGPTRRAAADPAAPSAHGCETPWVPSVSGPMRPQALAPHTHGKSAASAALERFRQAAEDAAAASTVPRFRAAGPTRPTAPLAHGPAVVRPPALEPGTPIASPAAAAAAAPSGSSATATSSASSAAETARRADAGSAPAAPGRAAVKGHTLSDADAALVIAQISNSGESSPPSRKRARSAGAEDSQA
ncbi:hypothetical protein FNF27_01270 [Cafeteria roenbergensis]|uniref:PAS domain-containing protein n=2 Tax=Cafeteria roenbergensis TaxID=33653 RepID=A0A5A8EHR8_CAFRO|nr:hypothetical protein FNF27_01270 [Cafeteria roenbergensis]